MTKPRIAVLIGGPSREYDVSRLSAAQILSSIDPRAYDIKPILITRAGEWRLYPSPLGYEADTPLAIFPEDQLHTQLPYQVDAAFIALHGEYGADGTVQRLLDRSTIPYQGSGPRASARAYDMATAYALLRRLGFAIPDYAVVSRAEWVVTRARKVYQLRAALGQRVTVSPNAVSHAKATILTQSPSGLADAIEQLSVEYDRVIVQRAVRGLKLSCHVVESTTGPVALPPVQTELPYPDAPAASQTAHLSPVLEAQVKKTALAAHRALQCRDYSQTDFVYANGRLWLLQLQTLPILSATATLPLAAAQYGLSFQVLIHHLIERARERPEVIELH